MFGLGWRDRSTELVDHLRSSMGMSDEAAGAFVLAYRKPLSQRLSDLERKLSTSGPEGRLLAIARGGAANIACVHQAVVGYLTDLRAGRHKDTLVGHAILGIIGSELGFVGEIDQPLATFLSNNYARILKPSLLLVFPDFETEEEEAQGAFLSYLDDSATEPSSSDAETIQTAIEFALADAIDQHGLAILGTYSLRKGDGEWYMRRTGHLDFEVTQSYSADVFVLSKLFDSLDLVQLERWELEQDPSRPLDATNENSMGWSLSEAAAVVIAAHFESRPMEERRS